MKIGTILEACATKPNVDWAHLGRKAEYIGGTSLRYVDDGRVVCWPDPLEPDARGVVWRVV